MAFERALSRYDINHFTHPSLNALTIEASQPGIHSIKYGSGNLDFYVENKDAKTTLVLFHAAVPPRVNTYPVFQGLTITQNLKCNLIFVSDPVLEMNTNLGWYAGDTLRRLQDDLPKALSKVLTNFRSHEHLVFFGPSGGGFAALYYSRLFPGSWAISMNPQTDISKYSPRAVDSYLNAAWRGLPIEKAPFHHSIIDSYRKDFRNHIIYVQNLGDRTHVPRHLLPFLEATQENRSKTALFAGKWGLGHKPAPGRILSEIFRQVISSNGNWNSITSLQDADVTSTASDISSRSQKYIKSFS
ncbi:hypothetical protein [Corynebacterium ammoniagenes]|uniref:Esterase n=1 Tax=Corynebacterium ammoniagenes DSM 20306 TaxID=649754 RepID=A0ABN0ABV1_CORAM|nr:hypothetical protein [Corynebacterium ammoniagenes]AQS73276.1 hypothetical protein CA40472_04680 [Corynebacterium ammoniagenes]EFG80258.1 hypothetical protein HMPREF0281_02351 [Corynebacterium ammoniagenes DSM 20306]